jgi:hypothetical protein
VSEIGVFVMAHNTELCGMTCRELPAWWPAGTRVKVAVLPLLNQHLPSIHLINDLEFFDILRDHLLGVPKDNCEDIRSDSSRSGCRSVPPKGRGERLLPQQVVPFLTVLLQFGHET